MSQEKQIDDIENCVIDDIKNTMIDLVKKQPINNIGSNAMRLLWQIFKASGIYFEEHEKIKKLNDVQIELILKNLFPIFIDQYPEITELDK